MSTKSDQQIAPLARIIQETARVNFRSYGVVIDSCSDLRKNSQVLLIVNVGMSMLFTFVY